MRLILCVMLITVLSAGAEAGEVTNNMQACAASSNDFAFDMYAKLRAGDGNLFFSPTSIAGALAMTSAGAQSNTALQMNACLHLDPKGGENTHASCGELTQYFNRPGKAYQLAVASRLWGSKRFEFQLPFLQITKKHYAAELQRLDFADAEAARKTINEWVEQQTQQKIKELIPGGVLNASTELVLTNAIYFKGNWASQFNKKFTRDADFFTSPNDKVSVPMMNQSAHFGYLKGENFQALELGYAGDELSMIVLLPDAKDGLKNLEAQLNSANAAKWIGALRETEIAVSLPKFKMTWNATLNEPLQALGMTDAFTSKADFSGIGGRPGGIYISLVLHKAFVDVNEEGTEAAAATAVVMTRGAAARPQVFKADHPFVFLIREKKSGAILFAGRVVNPL